MILFQGSPWQFKYPGKVNKFSCKNKLSAQLRQSAEESIKEPTPADLFQVYIVFLMPIIIIINTIFLNLCNPGFPLEPSNIWSLNKCCVFWNFPSFFPYTHDKKNLNWYGHSRNFKLSNKFGFFILKLTTNNRSGAVVRIAA